MEEAVVWASAKMSVMSKASRKVNKTKPFKYKTKVKKITARKERVLKAFL